MKNSFLFFLLVMLSFNAKAQDPNWSVTPANFQFSMTFTASLNINGNNLNAAEDKVAVFVNEEVRGVASLTYIESVNKHVAFLSAFSNIDNEQLTFKIYNSSENKVYEILEQVNFEIDGNKGGVFQSFSIAKPALNNKATVSLFSFVEVASATVNITDNAIAIELPFGTNLSNLTPEFSLSNGANLFINTTKQISGITSQDFSKTINYSVLSENEAVLNNYTVNVSVANKVAENPEILLNSNAGFQVKKAPILVNMASNVPVFGFSKEDVLLTNAIVTSIKMVNQLMYSLEIVPIKQGAFSIEIPENSFANSNNQNNIKSNKLFFNYDIVQPYVLSIKRQNPLLEVIDSNTLIFKVTFSEPVFNVKNLDFISISDAVFSLEKESDAVYLVTITNVEDYVGAVFLNINNNNLIEDKAGNLLLNGFKNPHQN